MEDNYLDDGELTFRKIGKKLKQSWLRIVVYILIAVMVSGLVMGIISSVKTTKYYTSKVVFSNDGITPDMRPWDTSLSISKDIKNVSLIGEALTAIGIEGEEKDKLVPIVIKNLSVTSNFAIPEVKEGEEAKPLNNFSFTIQLNDSKELQLQKGKHKELLDNIVNIYIGNYKQQYAYDLLVNNFKASENDMNYIYEAEMLNSELELSIDYANNLASAAPDHKAFKSKKTFATIAKEFEGLKNQLKVLNSYLATTGVMRCVENVNNELAYINQRLTLYNSRKVVLQNQIDLLTEKSKELADSNKGIVTPGTNGNIIVNTDNSYYMELVRNLAKVQREHDELLIEIEMLETVKLGYDPLGEEKSEFEKASDSDKLAMQKKANDFISNIVERGKSLTEELNGSIEDFNTGVFLKDAIKVTQPATDVKDRGMSTTMFVAIELIVVVIAFIIAIVVTNKKGKIFAKKIEKQIEKDKKEKEN